VSRASCSAPTHEGSPPGGSRNVTPTAERVAVVTGGGRGIGEAVARALARDGVHVVLAARTAEEIVRVADRIRAGGARAEVVTADVSRPRDVAAMTHAALALTGRVDILVNAAGIYGPIGLLWDVDEDAWWRALEVNLRGTFLCCHAVLPHMVARQRGKIINFSGGGATSPLPRFTAYGVSKTAVVRLTETLAEEVKEFNIQVNAIAPGAVATRLQDDVMAAGQRAGELFARIRRLRETGEGGTPPEVAAELARFLASERSGSLTGKLIAAPHDGWQGWDAERVSSLMAAPWLTLRRMDAFTLRPFLEHLRDDPDA
jgi:NAD(P)-dependent dehydrogenase (short-subunit alcohol dehydrogenase family)